MHDDSNMKSAQSQHLNSVSWLDAEAFINELMRCDLALVRVIAIPMLCLAARLPVASCILGPASMNL